jgi:hypothetical protein
MYVCMYASWGRPCDVLVFLACSDAAEALLGNSITKLDRIARKSRGQGVNHGISRILQVLNGTLAA